MRKNLLLIFVMTGLSFGLKVKHSSYRTDHFIISVDTHKKDVIGSIAYLFENSYQILTDFFDYHPKKRIQVLLTDEDDIGNGAAFAAQGWVVISLVPANFGLRGSVNWLPNVISHELAHIITFRKMGLKSKWLGMYLFSNWFHKTSFATSHYQDIFMPTKDIPPWAALFFPMSFKKTCCIKSYT